MKRVFINGAAVAATVIAASGWVNAQQAAPEMSFFITSAGSGKGAKPASQKERVRMLEEEATAREKALAEANDRVAQLEKSIKDMQRLLELKGVTPPKPELAN